MKGLKNALIFVAGGLTFAWAFARAASRDTEHPREGGVVYEDDKIKVTRIGTQEAVKGVAYATILYKEDAK